MKKLVIVILIVTLLIAGCAQESKTKTVEETTTKKTTEQVMEKKEAVQGDGGSAKPSEEVEQVDAKPAETKEPAREFTALVTHTGYTPNKFTVTKGERVRLIAKTAPGQDWHNHGFTIDEYTINVAVRSFDENNPIIIEFVADKEGTFPIYCKTCNEDTGSWKERTGSKHPDIRATLEVLPN